jgi:chromosome segregation ATPase
LAKVLLLTFSFFIDANLWDDITDLFDGVGILERLAEQIQGLEKTISELESDKLLQQANAVRCDNEKKRYGEALITYKTNYNAAYADHSAAYTALSGAEARKGIAEADISYALDMLYDLGGSSSTSDGAIEYWQEQLRDARARKSAAEVDIAMAQSTINSASSYMSNTQYQIDIAEGMQSHYAARAQYHRSNVQEIERQIEAKRADIRAKEAEIDRIRAQYNNPNDEEGGPGDEEGGPGDDDD